MIKSETEYREAVKRCREEEERIEKEKRALHLSQRTPEEIDRLMQPVMSFNLQLRDEIATYERLQRGEFSTLSNFQFLGRSLIALRIYKGWSQKELADAMDVDESQVSRDERNEYHGITIDRVARILECLGAEMRTKIKPPKMKPRRKNRELQSA